MRILYLGGYPRSGSTLLSRVLGEPDRSICVGETRYLWGRGLVHNVSCGCGEPFLSCAFWGAVGEEAFGGWGNVDARRMEQLDTFTNLPQRLPLHAAPGLRRGMSARIDEYVPVLERLYRAIGKVSGAELIVEMSKDPTFAWLLRRIDGSDVRVVHLVRDSRAVAYSWTRTRRMPSPIGEQQFMPRSTPTETAVRWLAWNGGFHMLRAAGFPYLKLRYESFVDEPELALRRLGEFAGTSLLPADSRLRGRQVNLGSHHIFSGNPMRTRSGWVEIDGDDEWRTGLPDAERTKVTALTAPLLAAYGYRFTRSG